MRFIILFGGGYFPGLIYNWPLVFILELLKYNSYEYKVGYIGLYPPLFRRLKIAE